MLTNKNNSTKGRTAAKYLKAAVTLALLIAASLVYSIAAFNAPTTYVQAYSVAGSMCGTWQSIAGYRLGDQPSHLLGSITVLSSSDAWAVGSKQGLLGVKNEPLAMHWNGTGWHEEPVSVGEAWASTYLDKVSAYSSNDIWAVGQSQGGEQRTFIVHWDGTHWQNVASPNPSQTANTLYSVAAISPKSAWAVGYYINEQHRQQPLIIHWDGKSWQADQSLNMSDKEGDLFDITAVSEDNVWAVGYYYPASNAGPHALMLHWDGVRWSMVSTPYVGVGIYGRAVAALSKNDIWAVGSDGERASTLHWDGISWRVVPNPSPAVDENNNLNGVAAISKNDVWATGVKWAGKHEPVVLHWDGGTWQRVPPPQVLTEQGFYGLAGGVQGDIWAVGQAYNDKSDSFYALTAHFTGSPCPAATGTPVSKP